MQRERNHRHGTTRARISTNVPQLSRSSRKLRREYYFNQGIIIERSSRVYFASLSPLLPHRLCEEVAERTLFSFFLLFHIIARKRKERKVFPSIQVGKLRNEIKKSVRYRIASHRANKEYRYRIDGWARWRESTWATKGEATLRGGSPNCGGEKARWDSHSLLSSCPFIKLSFDVRLRGPRREAACVHPAHREFLDRESTDDR